MAEMVGLSRSLPRRNGSVFGLLAGFRAVWRRLLSGRGTRIRTEEWPDYLLRDIGLGDHREGRADPRALPIDWPLR